MQAYKIIGKSHFGTEELDEAETHEEAEELACEYQIAFGQNWEIWIEEPRSMLP